MKRDGGGGGGVIHKVVSHAECICIFNIALLHLRSFTRKCHNRKRNVEWNIFRYVIDTIYILIKSLQKISARIFTLTSFTVKHSLSRFIRNCIFPSLILLHNLYIQYCGTVHPLFYVFKTFICHARHGRRGFVNRRKLLCAGCTRLGCKLHVCKQKLALSGRFWRRTASDMSSHNPSLDPESAFVDRHSRIITVLHPVHLGPVRVMDLHPGGD